MFDIGWSEMLVVGVVALVVIGPKDLPSALRAAGRMVGKARGVAREFQTAWEDAMREAELDEIRRKAEAAAGVTDLKEAVNSIGDPTADLNAAMEPSAPPAIEPAPPASPAPSETAAPPPPEPASTEFPLPVPEVRSPRPPS